MKTKVFISHSSKDKEVAGEVCQFLEAHGVSCWIAPRNVTPGKNYGAAIVDAIDECGVFVLILSGESNQSGQVVREVERAAAANAVIIPFRIENIQPSRNLEFYVSSSHWLDAVGPSRDKHLNELLSAITSWHGREKHSPTTTSSAAPGPNCGSATRVAKNPDDFAVDSGHGGNCVGGNLFCWTQLEIGSQREPACCGGVSNVDTVNHADVHRGGNCVSDAGHEREHDTGRSNSSTGYPTRHGFV